MSRVLGVLGGMGPAATLAYLARVQGLTPAKDDADHIRVVMDMNPQTPDRNKTPDLAAEVLAQMARNLVTMGAEVLAMPCNTAHGQAAGIRAVAAETGVPFIDMIAETTAAVTTGGVKRIGVLATPGGEALYARALADAGAEVVVLEGADRAAFMDLIYGVKAGEVGTEARAGMARLAQALVDAGAEALVAGCTEVPLLLDAEDAPAPLTDSAEVLAQVSVGMCL